MLKNVKGGFVMGLECLASIKIISGDQSGNAKIGIVDGANSYKIAKLFMT